MKFSPFVTAALMAIAPSMVYSENQPMRDLRGKKPGPGGGRGQGPSSAPSCNQGEVAVVVIFHGLDDGEGSSRKLGSSYSGYGSGGYGSGGYGGSHDINDFNYNGVVLCYGDVSNYHRWSEDDFNDWIAGGYGRPSSVFAVESDTIESFGETSQFVYTTTDLIGHRIAVPYVKHHGPPNLCDIAQGEYGLHRTDHRLFRTQISASGLSFVETPVNTPAPVTPSPVSPPPVAPATDVPTATPVGPDRKRKLQDGNNPGVTIAEGVTSTVGSLAGYLNGASKVEVDIGGVGIGFDSSPGDNSACAGSITIIELPYTRKAVQVLNHVEGTVYQSY